MNREEAIWWVNHLFEIRKEEYFNKSMMEDAKEVEQAQHMAIEALQNRPQGEWKYLYGSIGSYMTIHCPFCGETFSDVAEWKYNFCPNCGARMKGGEDE